MEKNNEIYNDLYERITELELKNSNLTKSNLILMKEVKRYRSYTLLNITTLLKSLRIAGMITDFDGNVLAVNSEMLELTNYTESDFVGQNIIKIYVLFNS